MISPPNLSRAPLGGRGAPGFGSTKFGGVGILDWGGGGN